VSAPAKFEIPKTVLSRTVGSETILLNLETSTYHSLNAVGGRFWALILEGRNLDEAVAILGAQYDVAPSQLRNDLDELCVELQSLSLLQTAS
jgi:hypothetical protein